jgi:hypothetical protein
MGTIEGVAALVYETWPAADRPTAVAIAWAGSRGNPAASQPASDPPGSTDRGLWLINSARWPDVTDECAADPRCSSLAALRIYRSAGWEAFPAYTAGTWRPYLEMSEAALERWKKARPSGSFFPNPVGAVSDALDVIAVPFTFLATILQAVTSGAFWRRVGLGVAGVVLVGGAVVWIARDTLIPGRQDRDAAAGGATGAVGAASPAEAPGQA